ncbi:CoA transferase [Mycobacterium sp. CVI_P3]|uniref:CoA transferase n=1 Tax=Mycobacterium pinniadriaticum TaxID=2994102 RepID=A0ABT3SGU7_9MYCO|nr:CoA transferase [Mycobacterium pinniadriaticum]MCX2931800.1 CoA transferase [Mycobacterium pinniadriaticum]MCX2938125.1 CoA transferase [Mycobacterium pinniadriaticum]
MTSAAAPRDNRVNGFFGSLRVVEIGSWIAAPCASALMADLGAQVIKIEPRQGDPGRRFVSSTGGGADRSPAFELFNRGKRSLVLDIAAADDRDRLMNLLSTSDVLITNMRAGTLERAGLDPAAVLELCPRLVYASITGLGLRGPERDRASYDVGAFWARSGLLHQLTAPGNPPPHPAGGYGDSVTALAAFSAVLVALLERERTGRGQLVESSLLQSGTWLCAGDLGVQAAFGRVNRASHRTESRTPLVNSYQTSDGRWLFLQGVESVRHFPGICAAIGREDLCKDERFGSAKSMRTHRRELIAILDEEFSRRPFAEWADRLDAAGVWWQVVASPEEVLRDRQLAVNDMLHDVAVGRPTPMVTSPFTLRGTRTRPVGPAPDLGTDSEALIREIDAVSGRQ